MTALSIDGSASGNGANGTTSASCSLTLPTAGDILVALVCQETNTGSHTTVTGFDSIPGVSAMTALLGSPLEVSSDGNLTTEIWWGYCSGTLSSQTIKANFASAIDTGVIIAFGVTGFTGTGYETNPWDAPATTATSTGTSDPTVTGVNTTAADTMVLGLAGANLASGTPSSGFTLIAEHSNLAGGRNCGAMAEFQTFTSSQSGLTVGWGDAEAGWMMAAVALAQNSSGGGGPTGGGGILLAGL